MTYGNYKAEWNEIPKKKKEKKKKSPILQFVRLNWLFRSFKRFDNENVCIGMPYIREGNYYGNYTIKLFPE